MKKIVIETDGTMAGTSLKLDGEKITDKEKVTNISFYASATFVSKYSQETVPGSVQVRYETVTDDGKLEMRVFGSDNTKYSGGIGTAVDSSDSIKHFLGKPADSKVLDIVEKILSCPENQRSREILMNRSYESLKDTAEDLGLKLE